MAMQIERRKNRSDHPDVALGFALQAAVRRDGAEAAVLATMDGLLVAGAGEAHDLEGLAAFAPYAGDPRMQQRAAWARVTCGHALSTAPIQVGGGCLLYASLGGVAGDPRPLADAARRILAQH